MKKRGQAAMEFLMTYGWAILVVLVAIGALAYFGVLTPEKFLPEKCLISAGLYCSSFKAEAAAGITMLVENSLPKDITVTAVAFKDGATTLCSFSGSSSIITGASATIVSSCTPALLSGARFKADITVTYDETGGLTDVVKTGSIIAKVA